MTNAIITGGSRGLGFAFTSALANQGWTVVIDGRDARAVQRAAVAAGEGVIGLPGDVSDPKHRRSLVEEAAAKGPIDLVVNNASTLGPLPMPRLDDLSAKALAFILEVNVVAPHDLVRLAMPHMTRPGAAIVNVTSDAAVDAYAGWGGYATSKAALEQMSAVLAEEHPELSVWWVDPGDMRTEMHQNAFPGEDISDRPAPEEVVPALMRLLERRPPSGRVRLSDYGGSA